MCLARICGVLTVVVTACTPETSIRTDDAMTTARRVPCDQASPAATVTTLGLAYDPDPTVVPVGSVVMFVMPPQHNVSSETSGLAVDFGATTCLEFPTAGTFTFKCERHDFMGMVTVQ